MTEQPQDLSRAESRERPIGKITHYFSKVGVGIIALTDGLSVGDTIHVRGATADFIQSVGSMQLEHQQLQQAVAGQEIGIKVDERVHEGDRVFRVV